MVTLIISIERVCLYPRLNAAGMQFACLHQAREPIEDVPDIVTPCNKTAHGRQGTSIFA